MKRSYHYFQLVRDEQLTWALRVLSVIGIFALAISLFRGATTGWHQVFILHILLFLGVVAIAFFQRHLSYKVRACAITLIPFLLGVGGIFTFGLAAGTAVQSLFTFCLLATALFGRRAGIVSTIGSFLALLLAGILFAKGALVLSFDVRTYLSSLSVWMHAISTLIISAAVIVLALGTAHDKIEQLLKALDERNHALETEVAERARVEAERHRLEEKVQRTKRLEDLATLAGGVAHDLNNILAGAVTYPDFLIATLPEDSPLRKPLETIKRSGIKAATIVDDLLTMARRGIVTSDMVSLNSIIADYFGSPEFDKLKSHHPKVKFELALEPELPTIMGSPFHLQKALMNLVSNSAEAIIEEGEIIVSTRSGHFQRHMGHVDEIHEGDYVTVTVSDTGAGMFPEDMGRIFEPFFTKKSLGRSGTGLGMTVVLGTVKDHDGHIDVQSTIGKGTVFTLYLPLTKDAPLKPQTIPSSQEIAGRGESILIVDDVDDQREIAAEMLEMLGYSVKTASSGEEALALLETEPADLLLLDMFMEPGMDGLETYRRALQIWPKQKAVIMSGYSESWRIKETQKLGAGHFVKKPFLVSAIGSAIRAELDKEKTNPAVV